MLWMILFCISLGGCSYLFINITIQYLDYGVNTNVVVRRESPSLFPMVTFCNFNPLNTEELVLSGLGLIYASDNTEKVANNYTSARESINLQNFYIENNLAFYINASLRQKRALNIDKMLMSCYYQRKKCNSSDFEYYFDSKFGNCYKFNSGSDSDNQPKPLLYANNPGYLNGLRMELFLGEPVFYNYLSSSTGVFLAVHNQSYHPLLPDEGIMLPSGKANSVVVSRTFIKKLSKPYSNCITDEDSFDSDFFS